MNDLAHPLLVSLENSDYVVELQLSDLKNEDAVRRARGDSGSSISWIIGHLLDFRCKLLGACGVQRANPYEAKFSFQTPATDGSDYPDIAELKADWTSVHGELCAALTGLDEERLLGETELPGRPGDSSLLAALAFYAWHEAYHLGAVGLLRAQWGYLRTHELAMEARSSA